ncbi:YppG family protein [Tuberibacillus calidus]|jgi:hypothetical protein|uniref:YppG family protein n=1 Tax=Tuberibacillus calidus TaxID=340097 RepID=UPI0004258294|nr:YppG family protein [Tuberibacillus calidus]
MANQNNQQPNMPPVDPFSYLMWGPPPGVPPYYAMPPVQQNQGQGINPTAPNFMNQQGAFDINKFIESADKMMKIINQTQPVIKQLGSLFNMFKPS